MEQTAVEWLEERYNDSLLKDNFISKAEFDQAKAMEKKQIIDAYNTSFVLRDKPYATADKYYNETFKSE